MTDFTLEELKCVSHYLVRCLFNLILFMSVQYVCFYCFRFFVCFSLEFLFGWLLLIKSIFTFLFCLGKGSFYCLALWSVLKRDLCCPWVSIALLFRMKKLVEGEFCVSVFLLGST